MLDRTQLEEFAERGFVVVRQVVPPEPVAAATRTIDALLTRRPPGDDVRGNHFYWPRAAKAPSLGEVHGRAGDLLLAHHLLGHNIGGNTSDAVRRAVYFARDALTGLPSGAWR